MRVLFAANEAFPIYKLGGLGDVIGSLPQALSLLDIDTRIAIPHHQDIQIQSTPINSFFVTYKHRKEKVTLSQSFLPNTSIPVYLFSNSTYLSTTTDASDNHADKYAFFSLCLSYWLNQDFYWKPQIVHLHDWHPALTPLILKHKFSNNSYKYLLTIHNLAYQANTLTPIHQHLDLKPEDCQILQWDYQDMSINILMEGILHSDAINTVSPNYAQEILTPQYSFGLDQVLLSKTPQISGILNGLDLNSFNPRTDPNLHPKFSQDNYLKDKSQNKKHLYQQLRITNKNDHKLISFIGRVDPVQKGISYIIEAIELNLLPPSPHQFIFLGVGNSQLEADLHKASRDKSNIKIITRFDESLARQIYAASDLLVIPSTYEPCGLVQMNAMRYGTLPIAFATGGLVDTITHDHNGFLFQPLNTLEFSNSINHALGKILQSKNQNKLIQNAIKTDFSWSKSAKEYQSLYQNII